MNVPISPWYSIPAAVGLLALTFVFAPGVLLHLGVLLFPKGHDRRTEFTAELYNVPYMKRPFWVAGVLVRCAFEGTDARLQAKRARESRHLAFTLGSRVKRFLLTLATSMLIGPTISLVVDGSLYFWIGIPAAIVLVISVASIAVGMAQNGDFGPLIKPRNSTEEKDS